MLPHSDPHDPANDDERLSGIALAALGEQLDAALATHVASCPICAQDLESLGRTVQLAREDAPQAAAVVQPPAQVWAGIAAAIADPAPSVVALPVVAPPAVALPSPRADGPSSRADGPSSRADASVGAHRLAGTDGPHAPRPADDGAGRSPRRWLLAAAAAVVLGLGGAVAGYTLGSRADQVVASCQTTQASLGQMPGGPAGVDGLAEVYCADEGRSLRVTTARLPLTEGFYEVWLFSPSTQIMVPIGTLGEDGTGSFTLPAGIDLDDFHIIDVSHQQFNGDPAHDQSVLQGPLTN